MAEGGVLAHEAALNLEALSFELIHQQLGGLDFLPARFSKFMNFLSDLLGVGRALVDGGHDGLLLSRQLARFSSAGRKDHTGSHDDGQA